LPKFRTSVQVFRELIIRFEVFKACVMQTEVCRAILRCSVTQITACCVFLSYSVTCLFQKSGGAYCPPLQTASTEPHSVTLKWR